MRLLLKTLFALIFVAMIAVTTWASLHESVVPAAVRLWNDPWGRATLFDTYFAFLTFYLWVAYKEPGPLKRFAWFLGVMLLGNIAISIYVLKELFRLREEDSWDILLTRRNS
jgi:hypothetical protein